MAERYPRGKRVAILEVCPVWGTGYQVEGVSLGKNRDSPVYLPEHFLEADVVVWKTRPDHGPEWLEVIAREFQ